jgi:hypothetical protein
MRFVSLCGFFLRVNAKLGCLSQHPSCADSIFGGMYQCGAVFSEDAYTNNHIVLNLGESVPLLAKFIREFYFPCHIFII